MLIRQLCSLSPVMLVLVLYAAQVFSIQTARDFSASAATIDSALHNSETVLVRYTEKHHLMRDAEGGASLQIYRDGYAVVYYPAYMRRAGKYGVYLDPSTLDRLWAELTTEIMLEFDKETVRQRLYDENQAGDKFSRQLSTVADASTTLIETYPNRYKFSGFGDGSKDATKKISWYGLNWDASKYREVPEIEALVTIQQILRGIMQQPDLQKIE